MTPEHEMRVQRDGRPATHDEVAAAIRTLDPAADSRIDPATGILHVRSARDTLDLVAALTAVGLEATSMTG